MMRMSWRLDQWPLAPHTPADAHGARVLMHASQLMLMMRGSRWLDDWLSATYVPADAHDARVYGIHPS